MKIYDRVKQLLTDFPETRDSDKKLYWKLNGLGENDTVSYYEWMKMPSFESTRRCRQKIQENTPELRGSVKVQELREEIEDQRGTHIYREEIEQVNPILAMAQSVEKFGKDWEELRAKLHRSSGTNRSIPQESKPRWSKGTRGS